MISDSIVSGIWDLGCIECEWSFVTIVVELFLIIFVNESIVDNFKEVG